MEQNESYVIIAPKQVQIKCLKEISRLNSFYDITWLTKEELWTNITFSFSTNAIYEVMKTKQVSYSFAVICLEHLRLLSLSSSLKQIQDEKITELLECKKELLQKGLLEENKTFLSFLKRKKIIVYQKSYLPKELWNFLSPFHPQEGWKVVDITPKERKVFEFKTMEEEVIWICEKISSLLLQKVSTEKIYITNVHDNYTFTLKRIFDLYSIPLNHLPNYSLYDSNLVQRIFRALNEKKGARKEEVVTSLLEIEQEKASEQIKDEEKEILFSFIRILNSLAWYPSEKEIDETFLICLEEELKKAKKPSLEKRKGISVIPFSDASIATDGYLFVLGVHQGVLPNIKRDEDYFSDRLRTSLGLETSQEQNYRAKEEVKQVLSTLSHVYLSYCLKDAFQEYYPSSIIRELKLTKETRPVDISSFSHTLNEQFLYKDLDEFTKYGIKKQRTSILYDTYPSKQYLQYRHTFSGINKEDLYQHLDHQLSLSYTSLNQYFQCPFAYYLNYILKINMYEDSFSAYIGRFYHYVLSHAFLSSFDFEKEVETFLKTDSRILSCKETFLLNALTKDLKEVVTIVQEQFKQMNYPNQRFEEQVIIEKEKVKENRTFHITIKGFIDRLVYQTFTIEDQEVTYVVIIDYKTGDAKIDLNYVEDGLYLQLPIYLFLAKHMKTFKHVRVYGFYLQHILHFHQQEEEKKKSMRLKGYTLKDCPKIYDFDLHPNQSEIIQGLKRKKDDTYDARSKVLTEEEMNILEQKVEMKINEAIDHILEGDFKIEPKIIEQKMNSCQYCPFGHICYHTYQDQKIIGQNNRGEEDA